MDISKKIRASKNAKFLNGEQLVSHPPYGYKKDPNLKNCYVIDEETAPVVRKIFEMYANGVGRNTNTCVTTKFYVRGCAPCKGYPVFEADGDRGKPLLLEFRRAVKPV